MPTGDLPGWHLVFGDDFNSGLDRSKWRRWSGQPGSSAGGWWDPSHVVVSNGVLNLNTYRDPNFGNKWVSGGVSNAYALKQAYGKYESRFRMDAGHGVQGILLLWPVVGWPPEIDFWEAGGIASPDLRNAAAATLHYGTTNSQIQRTVYADFSQWHTIGVEWTPGKLTYTLDGQGWATVSDLNVPSQPMEMDLMTQAGTCGDRWAPCPDSTTPTQVNMQVDWVVNWAYVP